MSDETAQVTTAADQTIAETVDTPSTHVPAVGGVNDEEQVKDETIGRKVCSVTRHLPSGAERADTTHDARSLSVTLLTPLQRTM